MDVEILSRVLSFVKICGQSPIEDGLCFKQISIYQSFVSESELSTGCLRIATFQFRFHLGILLSQPPNSCNVG
jgi:hypothetical protein